MRDTLWELSDPRDSHREQISRIASELGITDVTAALLWNRGMKTVREGEIYLKKEAEIFHDPFLMRDMDKAADRIMRALKDHEKITVYGDYDVDGVTSVSALYLYLKEAGADVSYYIPSREGEGYGVNLNAIDGIIRDGARLMITVDTGITAVSEVRYASEHDLDVIVTDHHECLCEGDTQILPEAAAVVNPRRSDCGYPFKELAGVGVVFKLLCALSQLRCLESGSKENFIRSVVMSFGDLVAIGTVADVMPLTDENRLIVSMGMELIEKQPRLGVAALLNAAQGSDRSPRAKKKKRITSGLIGYTIAPRINAAGRIAEATRAVELFITDSEVKADAIASELCETNRVRQQLENEIAEEAAAMIAESVDMKRDKVIVLQSDSWHQGVIGIVASRITEKYNMPAILITCTGDTGKGSGRSVKGLDLVEALKNCSDCLIRFGGHELAAGLSIKRDRIDEFRRRINEFASEKMSSGSFVPQLSVECELQASDLTLPQARELYLLEPYGASNPVPLFLLSDAKILDITPIGSARHTRFTLEKNGVRFSAVYFGASSADSDFEPGDKADVVFNLDINDFMNTQSVQLIIRKMDHTDEYHSLIDPQKRIYDEFTGGRGGEDISGCVPDRDDFVKLYVFIRDEVKAEHRFIMMRSLCRCLTGENRYIKSRFVIDILRENGLIKASEAPGLDGAERYEFDIISVGKKTTLESSPLYRRLLECAK